MKLCDVQNESFASGVQSSTQFKVAATPTMMRFLSDILYSDKILAPMRELATNAVDSHKAAGCIDKPFDVQLPSRDNPIFRIRDYGTGLSQQDMEKLYTTYGASNKNQSNDYNGCLGLGSKSPFAYCDTFTSTSYHNGTKYVYVAAKDIRGMPTLNLLLVEDTNEPNGLEISFPVKSEDHYDFELKANKLFLHMPTTPNIIGPHGNRIIPSKPSSENILYEGSNWTVYSNKHDSSCIMGYIEYPIDSSQFSNGSEKTYRHRSYRPFYSSTETIYYNLLQRGGIEIRFNIGEVDMNGSREGLQYNEFTKNAIKKVLDDIKTTIETEISKSFAECKTFWQALQIYHNLRNTNITNLVQCIKPDWNGRSLSERISVTDYNISSLCKEYQGSVKLSKRTGKVVIPSPEGVYFVYDDLKSGGIAASKREMSLDKYKRGARFWIIRKDTTDDELKDLLEHIGIIEEDLLYTSSFPKLHRQKTHSLGTNEKIKTMQYKPNGYGDICSNLLASDKWNAVDINFNDGGIYVDTCRYEIVNNGEKYCPVYFNNMRQYASNIGIAVDFPIYGIKSSDKNKYKKHPKWINFFDYIIEECQKIVNLNSMEYIAPIVRSYNDLVNQDKLSGDIISTICECLHKDQAAVVSDLWNNLYQFRRIYDRHLDLYKNLKGISEIIPINRVKFNETSLEVASCVESIFTKYPMIEMICRFARNSYNSHKVESKDVEECVSYIKSFTN